MKSLKINELKSIACIASVGKISTAASMLGTSQANLSRLLSSIETQIGLKIFDRSTRHLSLSDFGEALLPRIQHVLQANEDVSHFIDSYKEKPIGHVTIAAPLGALVFLSRYVMPAIAAQHKDISISLVSYTIDIDKMDLVMPPEWDLMFSFSMPRDENLIARKIAKFTMGLYASPDFMQENPIKKVNDLSNSYSCILLRSLGESYNNWSYTDSETGEVKNIKVNGKYLCDQAHYAVELARQGLGVVYAPLFLVRDDIEKGYLVSCFPNEFNVECDAYLLYRNRKYQPHRVNVIIEQVVAQFNDIESQKRENKNVY